MSGRCCFLLRFRLVLDFLLCQLAAVKRRLLPPPHRVLSTTSPSWPFFEFQTIHFFTRGSTKQRRRFPHIVTFWRCGRITLIVNLISSCRGLLSLSSDDAPAYNHRNAKSDETETSKYRHANYDRILRQSSCMGGRWSRGFCTVVG